MASLYASITSTTVLQQPICPQPPAQHMYAVRIQVAERDRVTRRSSVDSASRRSSANSVASRRLEIWGAAESSRRSEAGESNRRSEIVGAAMERWSKASRDSRRAVERSTKGRNRYTSNTTDYHARGWCTFEEGCALVTAAHLAAAQHQVTTQRLRVHSDCLLPFWRDNH